MTKRPPSMATRGGRRLSFRNTAPMSPRSLPLLPRILLFLAVGITIGGCRPGSPGKLTTWEKTRETLVAELLIPSFEGSVTKVDGLARAAGAPFSGADLRTLLMNRANAPSEILELVDLSRPIAAVLVVPTAHGEWFPAVALSTKPGAAARFVAALGREVSHSGAVVELKQPDGRPLFARVAGDTVVMAPSAAALTAAADVALGARRAIPDDLMVAVYPEAMSRAVGRTQADAISDLRKQALDEHGRTYRADGRAPPPAETATLGSVFDAFLGPLSDAAAAELNLTIDPAAGISLGTQLRPRAGTALARRLAGIAPLAFDTRVLGKGTVAAASGSGPGGVILPLIGQILAAQGRAGVRGATDVSGLVGTLLSQLDGSHGAALKLPRGPVAFDIALGLRPSASPAKVLESLGALALSPALGSVLSAVYGSGAPTVSARREGDRLRIDVALPTSGGAGPIALLRAITGKPSLSIVATVSADRRLLLTSDPSGDRLAQMAAPFLPPAPTGDLGTALASAPGKESFAYIDLWAFARPLVETFAGAGEAQAFSFISLLPGVSSLTLPFYGHQAAGPDLLGQLRVPMSTLKNIANVSRLVGGMGR